MIKKKKTFKHEFQKNKYPYFPSKFRIHENMYQKTKIDFFKLELLLAYFIFEISTPPKISFVFIKS